MTRQPVIACISGDFAFCCSSSTFFGDMCFACCFVLFCKAERIVLVCRRPIASSGSRFVLNIYFVRSEPWVLQNCWFQSITYLRIILVCCIMLGDR